MKFVAAVLGAALCAFVAFSATVLFRNTRIEPVVPLIFLLVIVSVALYFGSSAGMLGTVIACVIFMEFLFEPIHNLHVHNPEERSNLIWMVLGGLALSNLFSNPPPSSRRKPTA
jgi:K+-sensing histidine kinase KdpD